MIIKKQSIEIKKININDLKKEYIEIPIFQRFFQWNIEQTSQLLEDIENFNIENDLEIYLLDFIYFMEDGKFNIADGQQRLVTMNLLFKAINDYIKNKNLKYSEIDLFNINYANETDDREYKNNLNSPTKQFKKIYFNFLDWLENNDEIFDKIYNIVLNKIFIYIKKTSNIDDAYLLFQQINVGGKPLTQNEIIESTLVRYGKIYNVDANILNNKNLKKTLFSYIKFKDNSYLRNFSSIGLLTYLRDEIISNKPQFVNFNNFIKKVDNFSNNPLVQMVNYVGRNEINDVINVVINSGIDLFGNERSYLNNVIIPLFLQSIIFTIKGVSPGGKLRNLFGLIIDKIKNGENVSKIVKGFAKFIEENKQKTTITFSDFVAGISNAKSLNLNTKKALFLLDFLIKNNSVTINLDSINLEHVYPQNPNSEWLANGWPANEEDSSKISNNIGNLILLNQKINKTIKNKYITKKKTEYENSMDDALKSLVINKIDYNKFEAQKEKYIQKRARNIAEILYVDIPLAKKMIEK